MSKNPPTYSQIIDSKSYIEIMTDQHLYIAASDQAIARLVKQEVKNGKIEVIEIGCGPARMTPNIASIPEIHLTCVDHDPSFIEYAKTRLDEKELFAEFVVGDAENYHSAKPIDVFVSQGMHHHIKKGEETKKYLKNIYDQLKIGGCYILSDEFLPDYLNEQDRLLKLVIWQSHIIANAVRMGFEYLAQEEAKTLLDDIVENSAIKNIKTEEQILLTLEKVGAMNDLAIRGEMDNATILAGEYLKQLAHLYNQKSLGDARYDLSRGDYKICDSTLKEEIRGTGFIIEKRETCGLVDKIGGMAIYLLRK